MTIVYNPFTDNLDYKGTGGGGGGVNSVSGTANRITSTGGTDPIIDIDAAYVGQTSITTLGTVTTGTWNATTIATTKGGTGLTSYTTGDILYASASNTLSKLAIGTNGKVLTITAGIPSWQTPTTGTVTSVSGTAGRITSTGGNTPVIDIDAAYVGQTSITTLGTVSTGTWNATTIATTVGGTGLTGYTQGDILYSSGPDILAKLPKNTTATRYLANTGASNNPNWDQVSLSTGITGILPLANGGTSANLTASNGGIFYSTAAAGAILAGTATARQVLMSGSNAAPSWSTAVYPATTTANQLLWSDVTNNVTGLATTNNSVLTSSAGGIPNWTAMTANGQLLIGSGSGAPGVATLGINANGNIVNGSNSITLNPYNTAKYIVDKTANIGTHTTIAAALTAASAGETIFIRPETYTENLTLKAGVNLAAYQCDSLNGNVTIVGKLSYSGSGTVDISGIQLKTNSDNFLAISGSNASVVNLTGCTLNCNNNTGISYSTSNASSRLNIYNCVADLGTTGIAYFANSSSGATVIFNCLFNNTGGSSTASTISAGALAIYNSVFYAPITTSSTATFGMTQSGIDTSAQNATCLTLGGSGAHLCNLDSFTSGTASAISISNTSGVYQCYINSSNASAIAGAGTINYQGLIFVGTSKKIGTTTQTGGSLNGVVNSATPPATWPSAGYIGEEIRGTASSTSLTSTSTVNLTSIALTPGVWLISAIGEVLATTSVTIINFGISANSASFTGTVGGDSLWQFSSTATTTAASMSIPSFKVVTTGTPTYYLVIQATFSGTATSSARISAIRVA